MLPLGQNQLAVIQRWSAYTVEPVTLGTEPVGCYTEVVCLYSVTVVTLGTHTTSWLYYIIRVYDNIVHHSGHPQLVTIKIQMCDYHAQSG